MKLNRVTLLALVTAAAITLTGCVDNSTPTAAVSGSSNATTNAAVTVDEAAVRLLPKEIATGGKLVIGVDPTYAPNEFKDAAGQPIGWDVEIANAVAARLGLTPSYQVAKFDNIIPSVTGGKYDLGVSSFFDTKERQQQVDLVNYYQAGTQWASPAGKAVDPDSACGLEVAVQNGTTQALDDIPARSAECVSGGKAPIQILGFDTQDDANAAVALGRADAVAADSPVVQYAVAQSQGKLQINGEPYDVVLYGIVLAKNNGTLGDAVQTALQSMVDDGSYKDILTKWSVESGALDTIGINGATS